MTAPTFRDGYRRLKQAQKSSKGAPMYSLIVNRPLGRVFAALAYQLRLTPNQVTIVSACFTFTGIALIALAPPGPVAAALITIALVLGYALDAADGQLARLLGGGSLQGEWLDHVVDSFKIATLHLAVLIGMYRFFDVDRVWLLVPLVASAVTTVHFFGMLLTDLLTRLELAKRGDRPAKAQGSMLASLAKVPTDYGFLCLGFVLWAWPAVFVYFYLFVTVATSAYTLLVLVVWWQRLRGLDVAAAQAELPLEDTNG